MQSNVLTLPLGDIGYRRNVLTNVPTPMVLRNYNITEETFQNTIQDLKQKLNRTKAESVYFWISLGGFFIYMLSIIMFVLCVIYVSNVWYSFLGIYLLSTFCYVFVSILCGILRQKAFKSRIDKANEYLEQQNELFYKPNGVQLILSAQNYGSYRYRRYTCMLQISFFNSPSGQPTYQQQQQPQYQQPQYQQPQYQQPQYQQQEPQYQQGYVPSQYVPQPYPQPAPTNYAPQQQQQQQQQHIFYTPFQRSQQMNHRMNDDQEEEDEEEEEEIMEDQMGLTINLTAAPRQQQQPPHLTGLTVVTPQVPMSPMPGAIPIDPRREEDLQRLENDPDEMHAVAHSLIQEKQYEFAAEALHENIKRFDHIESAISLGFLYEKELIASPERSHLHQALCYYMFAAKKSGRKNTMAMHNTGNVFRALNYCLPAYQWYTLAVRAGDLASLTSIGCLYDAGFLPPHERVEAGNNPTHYCFKKAADYYRQAADRGHVDAMINLGQMYEFGRGVTRDEVLAYKWFKNVLSCGGEEDQSLAKEYLCRVHRKLEMYSSLYVL